MSSTPKILLIGGNGKIAKLMTPLMLKKSWNVTSLVRDPAQKEGILALQKDAGSSNAQLDVLVSNIEDVKTQNDAQSILDQAKPDWVIFSAGAGGKGPATRTFTIDRDAAIDFIRASFSTPSISKFLLISYLGSRRQKAPWWDDASWAEMVKTNEGPLKNYYQAKLAADEVFVEELRGLQGRDGGYQGVCLRPGTLTDEPAGKVELGKTKSARGDVSRASVAEVVVSILEQGKVSGWVDLLDGDEDIEAAVKRVGDEGIDCYEGEEY